MQMMTYMDIVLQNKERLGLECIDADENIIYQLIEHNKKNFIETASHIMDGHTEVAPLKYKQVLPCQFYDVIWTDAQWQSIYAKGQDILVAAAAGSVKQPF